MGGQATATGTTPGERPGIAGFDIGKDETRGKYAQVIGEIAAELSALMDERQKLFKQGGSTRDIEQAVKNLLGSDIINMLAKRGFLPRYAFPLDVVALVMCQHFSGQKISLVFKVCS
jgi:hypothetical protein